MDPTVQVAAVTGGFALVSTAVGVVAERVRRQNRHLAEVRYQVQNNHETNLREDMDKVIDGIATLVAGQRRHDEDIAGIRSEMRLERQERLAWQSVHNVSPERNQ